MESKKNRPGETKKTTDQNQAKMKPRQGAQPTQPKPSQTGTSDERPCY